MNRQQTSHQEEQKCSPKDRLNVIILYADDLVFGDLSCYGSHRIHMPNLDPLCQEGLKFTDAYAASAVCPSSRYSILTGRGRAECGIQRFPQIVLKSDKGGNEDVNAKSGKAFLALLFLVFSLSACGGENTAASMRLVKTEGKVVPLFYFIGFAIGSSFYKFILEKALHYVSMW